jgi:hypothetical protein
MVHLSNGHFYDQLHLFLQLLSLTHTHTHSLSCVLLSFPLLSILYKYDGCVWYRSSLIDNKRLRTHCFTLGLAYNNRLPIFITSLHSFPKNELNPFGREDPGTHIGMKQPWSLPWSPHSTIQAPGRTNIIGRLRCFFHSNVGKYHRRAPMLFISMRASVTAIKCGLVS